MGYEILSDDLLANNNGPQQDQPETWFQRLMDKIRWFKLHIFAILIIILGIFLYFNLDLDFDFGFDRNEVGVLTLSGNFDTFNENYSGDLEIESTQFSIISSTLESTGEAGTISLKNFSGTIVQINNSIVFNGTTQTLEYGKLKINTQDKAFTLISSGKTNTRLLLKSAHFTELTGTAKLDKTFNYEFENSSIKIKNYNTTFAYDGSFTFSGTADKFDISSPKHNLVISYDINSTSNTTENKE